MLATQQVQLYTEMMLNRGILGYIPVEQTQRIIKSSRLITADQDLGRGLVTSSLALRICLNSIEPPLLMAFHCGLYYLIYLGCWDNPRCWDNPCRCRCRCHEKPGQVLSRINMVVS